MIAAAPQTSSELFKLSDRSEPLPETQPKVYGYHWRHRTPKASIVLLHGLQSHAGWFTEAAEGLLDRGFSVYAPDRRGSGTSPAARGDISSYAEWFDEVAAVVRLARSDHPETPVHLLGHCFGGNVALGTALALRPEISSLIVLTPGLYLQPEYSWLEKGKIGVSGLTRPDSRFPVPFGEELFTRTPEVLDWIRRDRLGVRTLTARCLLQIGMMNALVLQGLKHLKQPLLAVEALHDRIADNRRNRDLLTRALGPKCRFTTFEGEHFLLAEPCKDAVLDRIEAWARSVGTF